jgi:magnesium-transporting ATPase (P-type)
MNAMDEKRQDVAQALPARGLATAEAQARPAKYGENAIQEARIGPWRRFLAFFWGPIPWMIEIAAILSAAAGRWEDFSVIASLLRINAGVGFWKEFKADNAIEALEQRLAPVARVRRDATCLASDVPVPAGELRLSAIRWGRFGHVRFALPGTMTWRCNGRRLAARVGTGERPDVVISTT